MSAGDAVAAVTARLAAVAGIGPHVYDMIRAATTDAQFQQIFVDGTEQQKIVRAWQVTRESTAAKDECLQAMSRTHSVVMTGFMSFQDGVSEPEFQALIEAICAAFDPYPVRHFDGKFDWSGPTQVEQVKLGMLGNVLVHAARLVLPVREFPL